MTQERKNKKDQNLVIKLNAISIKRVIEKYKS
jgi:hypothetical protein